MGLSVGSVVSKEQGAANRAQLASHTLASDVTQRVPTSLAREGALPKTRSLNREKLNLRDLATARRKSRCSFFSGKNKLFLRAFATFLAGNSTGEFSVM